MVTMKFSPVAMDENPENAHDGRHHVPLGIGGRERRIESPAGVDAACEQRIEDDDPSNDK